MIEKKTDFVDKVLKEKRIGFVYVLESNDSKFVKIGRSTRPDERVNTIRTQGNHDGRFWISDLQPDSVCVESEAHKMFSSQRQLGEWFSIGFDEAIAGVSLLLRESPSEQQIKIARGKTIEDAELAMQKFNHKFPSIDRRWEFCLKISKIARQMFISNLCSGNFLSGEGKENSDFEIFFSLAIYDMNEAELASYLIDVAQGATGSDAGDFMHSIYQDGLEKSRSVRKQVEDQEVQTAKTC